MPHPPGSEHARPTIDEADALEPAERRLLADEVADRIREAIMSGQLAPEGRVREKHLASVLRVSRGPVREALTKLEHEGLVVKLRSRATIVARLTPEDAEEIYSLRLALERLTVIRLVARASDDELEQLQDIVIRMAREVERGVSPRLAAQLDVEFHQKMVWLTGHARLIESWNNLKSQITVLLLSRNAANLDFRQQLVGGHQGLVDVLRARDLQTGLTAIESHLRFAYIRVLEGQGAKVPPDINR